MKITINQQKLIHTLEMITRVSIKHVTLPVLQCVLITVKDSEVTLKATNLEIGLEVIVDAVIEIDDVRDTGDEPKEKADDRSASHRRR